MAVWLIAVALGVAGSFLQYGTKEAWRHSVTPWAASLRAVSLTLIFAILVDPPVGPGRVAPPWVALDASASLMRGSDTVAWRAARDSVRSVHADSVVLFGDSVRVAPIPDLPADERT